RIKRTPTTADVKVVRLEEGMPDDSDLPIVVQLTDQDLELKRYKVTKDKDTRYFDWTGSKPTESASLSVTGKSVTGMIYYGKNVYAVEPIGKGLQAMVRLDQSKFPQDHPPDHKDSK